MARSAPPTFKTKLDRLYPRQDAPTQLALDYSPEEDAGLQARRPNKRPPIEAALLPALAVSFIDGLSESHPLCGNP